MREAQYSNDGRFLMFTVEKDTEILNDNRKYFLKEEWKMRHLPVELGLQLRL